MEVLELPVDDISVEDGTAVIFTKKVDFAEVLKGVENFSYHIVEADLQFIPQNEVSLGAEDADQLARLVDALENDEDIDKVWTNVN